MKKLKLPHCHWNLQKGRRIKPKKSFESAYKAGEYIIKHNLVEYSSYLCELCGKWHIGHRKEEQP